MNIMEEIVASGIGYTGANYGDNVFFSKVTKGFLNDYKLFGEHAVDFYIEIFGEEYTPIFESMEKYAEVLCENITQEDNLLYEEWWKPNLSDATKKKLEANKYNKEYNVGELSSRDPATPTREASKKAEALLDTSVRSKPEEAKKGLAAIWASIKKFGAGLKDKFPKIAGFLEKGVAWIMANPVAVLGVAGGAALLTAVIRTLKKKGEMKKARELQAKVDAAKKEEPAAPQAKAASVKTTADGGNEKKL